jgi:hypothetical protein
MSDYDWTEIRNTLETIGAGETEWTGSGAEAHQALSECLDAVADAMGELGFELEMPQIGDHPDWQRMPGDARELLLAEVLCDPVDAPDTGLAGAVLARLREGGGATMAMLREVTGGSDKDIRDAIKVIRIAHQSDDGSHPVSYSGRWWTAGELERMGKDLQPTARGTLKVASGKSEPRTYRSRPKSELLDEVRGLLQDHPDAENVVLEVITRVDESFAARDNYKMVCANALKEKDRAEANLRDAVELGRDVRDTDAAEVKLDGIEMSWQAKEEILAKGVEDRKEARDRKKRAEVALEQLMVNLRQLELPGVE